MSSFIVTFFYSSSTQSVCFHLSLDLEVRVLNTETDSQDLSFPQNGPSDSSIKLSASTFKQYSRNGQSQQHLSPSITLPLAVSLKLIPISTLVYAVIS